MNKEVKASTKLSKQSYFEGRAEQAKEAARREMGAECPIWMITKELYGKKTCSVPVKGKDGKVVLTW